MSKMNGMRDLSLIRESGSTARVLNLSQVYQEFGQTEEYQQQPLFRSKRLNQALILKHALRPGDQDLFARQRLSATKIVLPFASSDLRLGGESLFVGQINFERTLKHWMGGWSNDSDFEVDLDILKILDAAPSFDPFLLRERLVQSGFQCARCYFNISDADITRMRAFVGSQINKLVEMAFAGGGPAARDFSSKLAEKLMTDETARALDPLRETLRMTGDDYREGVFAWKGFLYYKWVLGDLKEDLGKVMRSIAGARVARATTEERDTIKAMRDRIVTHINVAANSTHEALRAYDIAYANLANGEANAFRDFLLKAPSLFIPIGEAVGVLKHVRSFWLYRYPDLFPPTMEVEEAYELFKDFDSSLTNAAIVQKQRAQSAAI
ncbi:MAG: hypothetical protein ABW199_10120 [Caulobacterales bacterium]